MPSTGTPLTWAAFVALVLVLLAVDLGLLNRRDHEVRSGEALRWVGLWAALALAFDGFVAWRYGGAHAVDFLTGYLLELSLSVDNLFVFVLVFAAFHIPLALQHRVLFWGILGALVLRAAMIVGGAVLLSRFEWLLFPFGAFLAVTGVRLLFHRPEDQHPERSWAYRVLRRVIPSTPRLAGRRFVTVEDGRRLATPLFLALVLIELSDVVFALDSVPAILGVTLDPFIVFTSNVFAILGLRSLYFVLARMVGRFEFLHVGLAVVLLFIGAKMVASRWVHVPSPLSLAVVVGVLSAAVAASAWKTSRHGGGG
jgi:tellurite resistance protein TerC